MKESFRAIECKLPGGGCLILIGTKGIADKAVARFKDRVRDLTRRHRGVSLERMIADLNPLLRGWAGYFGFSQWRELGSLDGWTRRRLRCVVWVQWKTRGGTCQRL